MTKTAFLSKEEEIIFNQGLMMSALALLVPKPMTDLLLERIETIRKSLEEPTNQQTD